MTRFVARFGRRFARAMAVTMVGIVGAGFGVVAISSPAAAGDGSDCPSGYFCWYQYANFDGARGQQYYYTSDYVPMPVLQRKNMSSIEKQWADGCLTGAYAAPNGHPAVWLKASSGSYIQGFYLVGSYTGQKFKSFSFMQPSKGGPTENMNNKFDRIWNYCRRK